MQLVPATQGTDSAEPVDAKSSKTLVWPVALAPKYLQTQKAWEHNLCTHCRAPERFRPLGQPVMLELKVLSRPNLSGPSLWTGQDDSAVLLIHHDD